MIDGYLHPGDEVWLADQAKLHNYILEIGCYKGKSTRILADNMPFGAHLTVIDHFTPTEEYGHTNYYAEFCENLRPYINAGRLSIYKATSDDAVKLLHMTPFDFIFIDACHDYEQSKKDLENYYPFCSGLFSGHDYSASFPGIVRAVNEKFGSRVITYAGTEIWGVEV